MDIRDFGSSDPFCALELRRLRSAGTKARLDQAFVEETGKPLNCKEHVAQLTEAELMARLAALKDVLNPCQDPAEPETKPFPHKTPNPELLPAEVKSEPANTRSAPSTICKTMSRLAGRFKGAHDAASGGWAQAARPRLTTDKRCLTPCWYLSKANGLRIMAEQ